LTLLKFGKFLIFWSVWVNTSYEDARPDWKSFIILTHFCGNLGTKAPLMCQSCNVGLYNSQLDARASLIFWSVLVKASYEDARPDWESFIRLPWFARVVWFSARCEGIPDFLKCPSKHKLWRCSSWLEIISSSSAFFAAFWGT